MRFTVLAIALCVTSLTGQQTADEIETLDEFIREGMELWQVPGMSVAVVDGDEVIFQRSYGIKNVRSDDPVKNSTLMMIGSTTKAITAAALGILVDEGKLKWGDQVARHMPEFQVADPYITANLTVTDLITHRAGFGNADLLWIGRFNKEEVLDQMRFMEPSYGFRDGFIYQNIMWAAAGKLVENISGMSWAEFVKTRIFDPLDMERAVALSSQRKTYDDYVEPHYKIDGQVEVIDFIDAEQIAPAGDIWADISAMSNWTLCMTDSGRYDGTELVSPETWNDLLSPQTVIAKESFSYPTKALTKPFWTTYAMGWFQQDYRGLPLSYHTGSLPGLIAIIGIIPEKDFGVYVMGNLDHAELRHAILYKSIDLFVHSDNSRDWNQEIYDLYQGISESQRARVEKMRDQRVSGTTSSLASEHYVGTYHSEMYGTVEITLENGQLMQHFGKMFTGQMTHWHYDTYSVDYEQKGVPDGKLTFNLDTQGKVSSLKTLGITFTYVEQQR